MVSFLSLEQKQSPGPGMAVAAASFCAHFPAVLGAAARPENININYNDWAVTPSSNLIDAQQ